MSRVAREVGKSGYIHIYSRGVNKQDIFLKRSDYTFFLKTISALSIEMGFDIIAYCLMPNHYHLVIYDKKLRFSTIVKRLSISYSMHFNAVYNRTGPLFQGRFGGKPIEDIQYLFTVVRYVHMNPQKAGICKMDRYKWSSYSEYVNNTEICNTEALLHLFGGLEKFKEFHSIEDKVVHKELEGSDVGDEEAVKVICDVLQNDNPTSIVNYSKAKRDEYIRKIRDMGISSKQLSRVTGLSIFTIRHVHR